MNGAESLVKTLLRGGVNVCFTNPGTSEMHFVAALDRHADMRCVLGLQENVVTGAADGYGRMAGKPAATLLHTGPGLSNGLANLHNARKARTPIVNIVGEHATYHIKYDAPLTSDIEGIARPVSDWVQTASDAKSVAAITAELIQAARAGPGSVATLILPADTAWEEADGAAEPLPAIRAKAPSHDAVKAAATVLGSDGPVLILMTGRALGEDGLEMAGRIATATGAEVMAQMSNARLERGAGRFAVEKVPYPIDQAIERLSPFQHIILVGAKDPVAFFAYPDKPSRLAPKGCQTHTLSKPTEDGVKALEMLCEYLGAEKAEPRLAVHEPPPLPTGALGPESIAAAVSALMPENAIVTDEGITTGRRIFPLTVDALPHSWLQVTGGSIGIGLPLAVGAAVACPERKVISLQADGSAMYTVQALWTQAREGLDVTTVIFSNRAYECLFIEMENLRIDNPGQSAHDMFEIDRPPLDWVALASGLGVQAEAVDNAEQFNAALANGLTEPGPYVIEAQI